MNEYLRKEGEIAFRLWLFTEAVQALKKAQTEEGVPCYEKVDKLYDKVVSFSDSSWMEVKSTPKEREDLQKLIDELTIMQRF